MEAELGGRATKPSKPEKESPAEEPEQAAEDEEYPDGDDAEETDENPVVEAPSELPKAVRDAWKDMPETARTAVLESQREMGRKLADQGRLVQGISPIRDALIRATKDLPALSNMKPQEVADEVMGLAKISADFQTKPVETIMSLVKQHGLEAPLLQILSGQQPQQQDMQSNAMLQKISQLERQLAQVSDPETLRQQIEQHTTQSSLAMEINQFAKSAEHWKAVEPHMPQAVAFVRNSAPDISPQDMLDRAYKLAVSQLMPEATQAPKQTAAPGAATVSDPQKTEAARKAKSVNIQAQPSGKTRTLTEDEELSRAFDRMSQS